MSFNLLHKIINNNPAIRIILTNKLNEQKEKFLNNQALEKKKLISKINIKKYNFYNIFLGASCIIEFLFLAYFIKNHFFYGYLMTGASWHTFLGTYGILILINSFLYLFKIKDMALIYEIENEHIELLQSQTVDLCFDQINEISKEVERDDLNIYLELIKDKKLITIGELNDLLNISQSDDILRLKNIKTEMLNQIYNK